MGLGLSALQSGDENIVGGKRTKKDTTGDHLSVETEFESE